MPAGTTPRFGLIARRQQQRFRDTLSTAAQQPADDKAKRNPHLLAHGHEIENLYPSLRDAGGALAFFADRGIQWWTNSRSGDRVPDATYVGPTRNLASSQVSCVNFLLPLASILGALRALLQELDADVVDVEAIVDGHGHVAPIEFEWVGWREPLEGGRITRGANQTSIDALIVARTTTGRRAYLIEWKYCEEYLHPEDKGEGRSGDTRKARYRHLYAAPTSSFNGELPFEELLYELFYQLMRMLLVGDRSAVYSDSQCEDKMGEPDYAILGAVVSDASATGTLALTLSQEDSPDRVHWASAGNIILDAQQLTTGVVQVLGGQVYPGTAFVRVKIELTGTAPKARLALYVTGRDQNTRCSS